MEHREIFPFQNDVCGSTRPRISASTTCACVNCSEWLSYLHVVLLLVLRETSKAREARRYAIRGRKERRVPCPEPDNPFARHGRVHLALECCADHQIIAAGQIDAWHLEKASGQGDWRGKREHGLWGQVLHRKMGILPIAVLIEHSPGFIWTQADAQIIHLEACSKL